MRINQVKIGIQIKITVLTCLFAILSCVDPVSFDTDSGRGELVFFGNFTQLQENHVFNISRTSDFGKPVIPVSSALIYIFDDQGNSAVYQEIEPGKYELDADLMQGVPGRSYHIEISLADGRTYCSIPQEMPEAIAVENIYFKIENIETLSSSDIIVEQTFINIYVDTPLWNKSGVSSGLRWIVDEAYSFSDLKCHPFFDNATTCYFNIPIDESEVQIFKSEDENQEDLIGYRVHSRQLAPDDEFIEKHYFSVHQYTISDETYNYWEKIKIVANQTGSLFDFPPARIAGNIYEKGNQSTFALGFFEVNGQHLARTYTLPTSIGDNKIIRTCPDNRSNIVEDKCCFCWLLDEERNRIERPEYW